MKAGFAPPPGAINVAATTILMPHYFLGRLFLIEVLYEEAH